MTDNVVYEPDRNMPPDFLVNGELAVEVRTLNENYFGEHVKGLERDRKRVERVVNKALRRFDRSLPGQAYWVTLRFSRPLGDLKRLETDTRQKLQEFLDASPQTPHEISLRRNITIIVLREADKPHRQTFTMGMQTDGDSGGFVEGMYVRNIRHCIDEKTKKIQRQQASYSRWWLILVDYLSGFSPGDPGDARELTIVRESLTKPDLWERILVLEPSSGAELLHI